MSAARRGIVVAVLLAVVLVPIYWMVAASLKSNKEITQDATLYPHNPSTTIAGCSRKSSSGTT